jgi:hypothetical protein
MDETFLADGDASLQFLKIIAKKYELTPEPRFS